MLVRSLDAVWRTLTFTSPHLTTAPMRHILCRSSRGRMSGNSKLLDWPLTNYFWLLLTFCEQDMCQQLLGGYFWHRGSEQTHKWFPWEDHMFHSQTRSRPLSGTLLNFGPSQAASLLWPHFIWPACPETGWIHPRLRSSVCWAAFLCPAARLRWDRAIISFWFPSAELVRGSGDRLSVVFSAGKKAEDVGSADGVRCAHAHLFLSSAAVATHTILYFPVCPNSPCPQRQAGTWWFLWRRPVWTYCKCVCSAPTRPRPAPHSL